MNCMLKIGLTGGIGSGKSTVTQIFKIILFLFNNKKGYTYVLFLTKSI